MINLTGPRLAAENWRENKVNFEERLTSLELQLGRARRHNRWLFVTILLVAGGLALLLLFETSALGARAQGPAMFKAIRTESLRVGVENDKACIVMVAAAGGPILGIQDKNGKNRVALVATVDGPSLTLNDESGKSRIAVTVANDSPILTLFDGSHKGRIMLSVTDLGVVLGLADENGKLIWAAPGK